MFQGSHLEWKGEGQNLEGQCDGGGGVLIDLGDCGHNQTGGLGEGVIRGRL